MNKDKQLILELCRFISPNHECIASLMSNSPDWGYVLGQLLYHRMGSIAYKTICDSNLSRIPNREFMNTLKKISYYDHQKSDSMKQALEIISDLLGDVNFPYALLKGSFLIELYPPGLRTSNDIDFLVKQCDLSKIEKILIENGFKQGYLYQDVFKPATRSEILSVRMNRGETVPFIKKINLPHMIYLEIDVNFSLDFKAIQEIDIVKKILKNIKNSINVGKTQLYTLDSLDFFIHLCVHLYKEATTFAWVERDRDLSLYKFTDLYLTIHLWLNNYSSCMDLADRIKAYGLQRECYYSISYTMDIFSIDNEYLDKLLSIIRPESTAYLKEVYDPSQKKTYRYNESFINWLFTVGRKEHLYEITNE